MAAPIAPAAPRVPQARPYRDFLTPSLHRRFTNAAFLGLGTCWIVAVLLSEPGRFWSWFPLGPATVTRTLLLFISSLSVFILRVAQMHFGPRTTMSAFETFWQYCLSRHTIQTFFWYLLSAFMFAEVYIFSTSQSANLAWIDPGRSYERPRLNERPVLLRTLFVLLAIAQSALHLYRDYDLIVPSKKPHTESFWSSVMQIQEVSSLMLHRELSLVITTTIVGPLIYFLSLRSIAWTMALKIGRSMFTLSKQVKPSGLTDITTLMVRFAWSAFLLAVIWEVSNQAFTIFTAKEPLKKDQPLTTDSKDPNGSLINGLKAKKEIPRSVAFWELNTISARFTERRVTLYQDIERRGGSTWSHISNICLAEIQSISQRIQDCQQPLSPATTQGSSPQQTLSLPKIAQPLKNDNIFGASPPPTSTLELVQGGVDALAKHYGNSPAGPNPVIARGQKLLEYGGTSLLGDEKRQQLSRSNLTTQANGYLGNVLRSPLGMPFRRPLNRQLKAVVFGVPYSNANLIINAVQSLCNLVVGSLKEDRLGQVQKDIAMIVRVLVRTIDNVQTFLQTLPPHWTDVEFNGNRHIPDVEELLSVMRAGLANILINFGEYAGQLGLTPTEIRLAKQVAGSGQEMQETKKKA